MIAYSNNYLQTLFFQADWEPTYNAQRAQFLLKGMHHLVWQKTTGLRELKQER
jgi:hypothetical protein